MPHTPILQVRNYSKQFYLHEQAELVPASQGVNFTVHSGQLTALIGPTGAGKSSVLKGIYRTYLASQGEIIYQPSAGHHIDLAQADEHTILQLRRQEIAFVTQFLHVLPRQACADVVSQPLINQGRTVTEARAAARAMLKALHLPERLWGLSPATFSGGEKQRINLARGFVAQPRLLLLDEPTASLDPATTELVVQQIQQLKRAGVGLLAIFHQPDMVARLADSVVELQPPLTIQSNRENNAQ